MSFRLNITESQELHATIGTKVTWDPKHKIDRKSTIRLQFSKACNVSTKKLIELRKVLCNRNRLPAKNHIKNVTGAPINFFAAQKNSSSSSCLTAFVKLCPVTRSISKEKPSELCLKILFLLHTIICCCFSLCLV